MEETENKANATRRDAVMGRLKKKYPDRDFADDEAIFGAIDEDYGEAESNAAKMQDYEKNSSAMVDMFYKNPRVAAFFNACRDGEDPIAFLMENYGDDFREALESEEGKEKFSEKHQAWLDRVASEKKLEEESQQNLDATISTLDQFQQEKGLSDEQATEVFDKVHQVVLDGIKNIITRETFEMAYKALNYDGDVAEAGRVGEIKGRNAKIEDKLRKKEMPAEVPPTLGSTASGSTEPKPKTGRRNPFRVYDDEL